MRQMLNRIDASTRQLCSLYDNILISYTIKINNTYDPNTYYWRVPSIDCEQK